MRGPAGPLCLSCALACGPGTGSEAGSEDVSGGDPRDGLGRGGASHAAAWSKRQVKDSLALKKLATLGDHGHMLGRDADVRV